jgi:hypothetical protein
MQFTTAGDVNIAYQAVGDGPIDLVWAWGLASSIEVAGTTRPTPRSCGDCRSSRE